VIEKIEQFLFDILGLVVPGVVLLCLLCVLPAFVVDTAKFSYSFNITGNFIGTNLVTWVLREAKILDIVTWQVSVFFLFIAYLIGHTVKVFAKYQYDFCSKICDETIVSLIKFVTKLINIKLGQSKYWFLRALNRIRRKRIKKSNLNYKKRIYIASVSYIINWLNYILGLFTDMVIFKPADYSPDNRQLYMKIKKTLKDNYGYSAFNWYSLYKMSNVILNQEKISTLYQSYLAKYNLYRSLAFIFLSNIFYIIWFYNMFPSIINKFGNNLYSWLIIINFIAWWTFHVKYKRYWLLCGNETLLSVYYFLKKEGKI
jgi:hypothetical protein